jgi:hypothetical protein
VKLVSKDIPANEGLKAIFPTLFSKPMNYLELKEDPSGESLASAKPIKIAVVLSGGQAAGGHNVIMGVFDMIKQMHPES